jgi:cob(I)alamin adenosyltransferase
MAELSFFDQEKKHSFSLSNKGLREDDFDELLKLYTSYTNFLDAQNKEINHWIDYGGGSVCAAHFDFASTICREAERALHNEAVFTPRPLISKYINLLSKFLFITARTV